MVDTKRSEDVTGITIPNGNNEDTHTNLNFDWLQAQSSTTIPAYI